MTYDWLNVGSPFFWLFWCGLFAGGSVNRATRPAVRGDRWTAVFLFLTVAVATATCAFVVPHLVHGVAERVQSKLLVFTVSAAVAGYLGTRFKLAAGIPLLAIVAFAVLSTGAAASGFRPLSGGSSELARLRVLSASAGAFQIEIDALRKAPEFRTVTAQAIAPEARLLRFDEAYFFLRSREFLRLDAIGAYRQAQGGWARVPENDSFEPAAARGIWAALPRLPGVSVREVASAPFVPLPMTSYTVEWSVSRAQLAVEPDRS